jgi:hypothetical protein
MPEAELSGAQPAVDRRGLLAPAITYARRLWRGEIPLVRVFWTDMIVIGSLVNIVGTAAAMLLFVSGAPVALGVIVHFAPVPYNILLFLAVWQSAARQVSRWSFFAQIGGLIWMITAIVL